MENDRMRILAVDDNADNLTILKALISEAFPQTEVLCAYNGAQALEMAAAHEPDMILLDIIMPGMDGYEVSRRLKSDSQLSDIPIVFVTALKSSRESRITALECGAEAFLTKPIDESELTAQIRAMLKIRKATLEKRDESKRLAVLVDQRTNELKKSNERALYLLEELKGEYKKREQSERSLLEAQTLALLGSFEYDITAKRLSCTDTILQICNYTREEFEAAQNDLIKLIHPDDRQTLIEMIEKAIATRNTVEFRFRLLCGDPEPKHIFMRVRPEYDAAGTCVKISGIMQDITRDTIQTEQLKQNLKDLTESQQIAHVGTWRLDIRTTQVVWSNELYKMFDLDPNQPPPLLPEHAKLFSPSSWYILSAALERAQTDGTPYELELQTVRSDGSNGWMWVRGEAERDNSGQIVSIWGAAQDISRSKKIETELRESQERFQMLFNKAPLGYQSLDSNGCLLEINQKWLDTFGFTREEAEGRWFGDFLCPEYKEAFRKRFELFKAQGVIHSEFEIPSQDGQRKFLAFEGKVGYDENGNFVQTHCIMQDITNQRKAESALRDSEERYKYLFENSGVGIGYYTEDGVVISYNKKALETIGGTLEDYVGKSLLEIYPGQKGNAYYSRIKLAITSETPQVYEDHLVLRGTAKWFSSIVTRITDASGQVIGVQIATLDITEKRKAEEEINFLAYHDHLTNVYNRRFFEDEFVRINTEANFPLAIITGDLNGLKLINDSIGHAAGDQAISLFAAALQEQIRGCDILGRIGGDEFGIILPKYTDDESKALLNHLQSTIRIKLNDTQSAETQIELSAAYGYSVQTYIGQTLDSLMNEAETFMYRRKFYEDSSKHSHVIDAIMNTLFEKSVREQQHSIRVGILAAAIAEAMQLDEATVAKVKAAGALHDIGKIGIDERILNKTDSLTEFEWNLMKQHPVRSARILATIDAYLDIVPFVKSHHERYDGLGYPSGLSSTQIPLEARIICVADAFDAMTKVRPYRAPITKEVAAEELNRCAGSQFDPHIVEVFTHSVLPKLDVLMTAQ